MPKALCMVGMAVAILLLIIFTLDLVASIPFQRASLAMDISMILCGLMLGYTSWTTFREQV
jgi:threonine/homoserine/homoserine lactone efflux protein